MKEILDEMDELGNDFSLSLSWFNIAALPEHTAAGLFTLRNR